MKRLIKISDYYYVVDDKAEIKEGDIVLVEIQFNPSLIQTVKKITESRVYYKEGGFDISPNLGEELPKIIATTNPSLPLPQIINASDDMIDKEVEIFNKSYEDHINGLVTLKPISKETSTNKTLLQFPSNNLKELLKEETLEEAAEEYRKLLGYNKNSQEWEIQRRAFIAGAKYQAKLIEGNGF